MLGNEFRFLQPSLKSGTLLYDVIPYDRQTEETRDYTGVRLNYSGPSGIAAGINYNRVSDDNYFVDFSSTILGSSQKILPQEGSVSDAQTYWNTAVRVTKNQILQDPLAPVTPPYAAASAAGDGQRIRGRLERLRGGRDPRRNPLHQSLTRTPARVALHLHPRVAYPILNPGWFIHHAACAAVGHLLQPRPGLQSARPVADARDADPEPRHGLIRA